MWTNSTVEIDPNTPLKPGDRIILRFKRTNLWLISNAIGMLIEEKLRSNPNYELLDWDIGENTASYLIQIKEPSQTQQAGLTAVLIASAVIAGSLFVWLSLDRVYKIIDTPAGQVATLGIGSLAVVIAVVIFLGIIGIKKR